MKHECRCRTPGFCEHHGRTKVGRQWEICNHQTLTPERCHAYWCLWERSAGRASDLEAAVRAADRADRRRHFVRPLSHATSCYYRGPLLRNEPSEFEAPPCMEHVFSCALHAECSLAPFKHDGPPAVCSSCPDQVRKIVLDADTHGYGDACAAAWISEGAKQGPVRLVHYSDGPKAELLRLLGQEVTDDPTGAVNIESIGLLQAEYDQACAGGRLAFRSRALGISSVPRRPPAEIDPNAVAWAAAFTKDRHPILLCPQTCFANREWPFENWKSLAQMLRDEGRYFLVLCGGDDARYDAFPEYCRETAGNMQRMAALVGRSALVIGNDSFPVNLAGTLGVPALALCGPTTAAAFEGMPSVRSLEVPRTAVSCSGCWFRGVYNRHFCDSGCVSLANLPAPYVREQVDRETAFPEVLPELVRLANGQWIRGGEFSRFDNGVAAEVCREDIYRVAELPTSGKKSEVVVDVGAHIGSFAIKWHEKNPRARLVCIEVCPENIPVLTKNVGEWATIITAACTYERGRPTLHNTIMAGATTTCASYVSFGGAPTHAANDKSWEDRRPLKIVSLEDVLSSIGASRIDVLKLDCEGSEFSILEETPSLDRIGYIVGEYHQGPSWRALRQKRFAAWEYRLLREYHENLGLFWLKNPRFRRGSSRR